MNWAAKVAAYKLLSVLPGGGTLYRFCQERVTHSLAPTRDRVGQKIGTALKYYAWLVDNGLRGRLIDGVHLDFGAGWHPTIPLLYYCLGTSRQHLFDVTANLDRQMLQQTLKVFLDLVTHPQWPHRAKLARLPAQLEDSPWRAHLERLGILYHALCGDAFASLSAGVDVVTSTQALLHVPRSAMPGCFRQIHASLKSSGLFMATVYLQDILTGNLQTGVNRYGQLQYSPETWERWFSSSIMRYNRFRAPDYREMLEEAGFEVVHCEVEPPTAEDYAELDRIRIAACFQRYTRADLAAKCLFFVARKR